MARVMKAVRVAIGKSNYVTRLKRFRLSFGEQQRATAVEGDPNLFGSVVAMNGADRAGLDSHLGNREASRGRVFGEQQLT